MVERWRRGDPGAFEELVRRWQTPIARFLARMGCADDQVADLCQEVFLRVYLVRGRYRETGCFRTWLYQIALNAARDASRRRQHRQCRLVPRSNYAPPERLAEDGESFAQTRELIQLVQAALAKLPELLREVLVLRHYEALTFEEMSRVLETPASTLKSRFAQALIRLKQHLPSSLYNTETVD